MLQPFTLQRCFSRLPYKDASAVYATKMLQLFTTWSTACESACFAFSHHLWVLKFFFNLPIFIIMNETEQFSCLLALVFLICEPPVHKLRQLFDWVD